MHARPITYRTIMESISLDATIKSIVTEIENSIPGMFDRLKTMADSFVYNKGSLGGFGMVASGVSSKWYQTVYFNRLQNDLYDLVRFKPQATEQLKRALRQNPSKFSEVNATVPAALIAAGNKLGRDELVRAASNWNRRNTEYLEYLDSLNPDDEDRTKSRTRRMNKDYEQTLKSQHELVDQVINQVLDGLKPDIARDIKRAISRAPNKLSALEAELDRRGYKIR